MNEAKDFTIPEGSGVIVCPTQPLCAYFEGKFAKQATLKHLQEFRDQAVRVLVQDAAGVVTTEQLLVRKLVIKLFFGEANGVVLDEGLLHGGVVHCVDARVDDPRFMYGRTLFYPRACSDLYTAETQEAFYRDNGIDRPTSEKITPRILPNSKVWKGEMARIQTEQRRESYKSARIHGRKGHGRHT